MTGLSGLSGLSGLVGAVAAAFTPAAVADCVLGLDWQRPASLFQDTAGTTPATTADDPVGHWTGRVGAATAANSGQRMVLKSDGVAGNGDFGASGPDWKKLALDAAVTLAGDFTVYCVCKRSAAGRAVVPLGGLANGLQGFLLFSDDNVYAAGTSDYDAVAYTGTASGVLLLRWRRASGVCYFAATGMAEAAMSRVGAGAGSVTMELVNGRGDGNATGAAERQRQVWVYARDLTLSGGADDALVRDWLSLNEGVAL